MNLDYAKIKEIESIDSFKEKILAAAVMYAEAGYYVIPIRPNHKAIPGRDTGINYTSASRSVDTVVKWFGAGGKFEGWNIGLACGASDGIFVIDIDTKSNPVTKKTGFDTLADIESDYGPLDGLVQVTPSGGKHYVFRWFDNGNSSTSKIGWGVDTRGGDGQCRSHIVAWPSEIDGQRYEWEKVGNIPDAPDWLSEILGEAWDVPQRPGRGSENVDDEDTETLFTPREIWQILQSIKPDDLSYEDWLAVGQAIHSQHPDATGLKLWDSWSQKGDRYQENECHSRWRGFKSYGPIRIGTLIYHAKRFGYVPKPKVEAIELDTKSEYDQLIDELNEEWGIVVVGGKIRIIGKQLNADPKQDVTLLGIDDFKNLTMNKKTVISGANGQTKAVPKTAIWLADERRKEYTGGLKFRPDQPTEFMTPNGLAYNLWRGWQVKPKPGTWDKLKAHLLEVVCRGNEEHYTWLMDWMADMFQDPANPKGCAVVMKGVEGSGKGTIVEAIGRTIGRHYKHLTQEEHLTGRFSGHLEDALLIFADEVVYGGSKKHAGTLKALVTERNLTVERKGIDAYQYYNCARLMIASNEDWFIPAGPESRRWFVLETSSDKANNINWFNAIHRELDNGGVEAMMYELMNREITSNLKHAPETEMLKDQRLRYAASHRDSLLAWLSDCLELGSLGVQCHESNDIETAWPALVDRMEIYTAYMEWANLRRYAPAEVVNKTLFYSRLEGLGFKCVRPTSGGTRKRMFQVTPLESMVEIFEAKTNTKL